MVNDVCSLETNPARAEGGYEFALHMLRTKVDHRAFALVLVQWGILLLGSFGIAAHSRQFRFDVLAEIVIGAGLLSALPLWMLLQCPGAAATRWTVGLCQGGLATLLWSVSDGRVESQAHLLGWLVVLAGYRDVRLIAAVSSLAMTGNSILVATGHVFPWTMEGSGHLVISGLVCLVSETALLCLVVRSECRSLKDGLQNDVDKENLQADLQQSFGTAMQELVDEGNRLRREIQTLTERLAAAEEAGSHAAREVLALRREFGRQGSTIVELTNRKEDSTLPADWSRDWKSVRQAAQQMLRTIDFPLQLPLSDRNALTSGNSRRGFEGGSSDSVPADHRALLVIQNPLHKDAATKALEAEGYVVDATPTGPGAFYSLLLKDYSMIVVDVDLPGEEGFDTLDSLKMAPEDRVRQLSWVIALANEMTPDRILRCTNADVDSILLKPLTSKALRKALNSRPASREGQSTWHWNGTGMAPSLSHSD